MSTCKHRFTFASPTNMADVDAALLLALWGTESLHGVAAVQTDAPYYLDEARRTCLIDASLPVGRDLSRLFIGYLSREFDDEAFKVTRIESSQQELQGRDDTRDCGNGQGSPLNN